MVIFVVVNFRVKSQNCDLNSLLCETFTNLTVRFKNWLSICIGNSDDHFRNHGFLLTAKGWTLAPAFDLNPTINRYQGIIKSVKDALKDWQKAAKRFGAQERDINLFSQRFITE